MATKTILPLAALLSLGACNFTPAYKRPDPPIPQAWTAGPAVTGAAAVALPRWGDYFTNPEMKSVIGLALAHNRDLRVAALNVEKVQAAYGIQRAGLFPTIGVSASGARYKLPSKMLGGPRTVETDTVSLGVLSWELDLFGRVRSLNEQALNQYLATEQAKLAAQISIVAAVAQQFFAYAADAEYLTLSQSTFESQKAYAELIRKSYELGIANELALRQAESQVESARADVARFRGLVAIDRNALNLLVGTPVPEALLPKGLDATGELKDIAAGLPSEVLLRRPDILMAEHQLKAANANIGAARAAFFPRISLTGGIGTMSPELSSLFSSGTGTWSFTPQISIPLFAGGALRAGLKVAEVTRNIAVVQYETAIQSAFREVSDGLVRREALTEQLAAQFFNDTATTEIYTLSELRYKEGLEGYLNVLVAQRTLYSAQQGLTATRLARQANQITLFKALGGQL